MDVTWDPPLELQGRLIGYKVQFENLLEDGTYQTREVMVCSPNTTLTGLQINTRYRVRVAAGTRRGFSPFSELSEGGQLFINYSRNKKHAKCIVERRKF